MEAAKPPKKYFVSTRSLMAEWKQLAADVAAALAKAGKRGHISEQLIANATWLWMREMDPTDLAGELRQFVDKAQTMLREDDADVPKEVRPVSKKPKTRIGKEIAPRTKRKGAKSN